MRFSWCILAVALLAACDKKKQPDPLPPDPVPTTTGSNPTPENECKTIPPPPAGFSWIDSTIDANKKISAFFYNPANSQELLVVVEGDILGGNQLFAINQVTRESKLLAQLDKYLPSINKKGWIIYSTTDDDVYKIKANGDSLTRLTTTHAAHDPKWDYTGKAFYYVQDAFGTIASQLIKADAAGNPINNWPHSLPYTATFHKSDKVVLLRNLADIVTVYMKDMSSAEETVLFSGPYDQDAEDLHFRNICVDESDANFYWSNSIGLFVYNLASKRTDTLFKNCETLIFKHPLPGGPNEVTFSKHTIKTSAPYYLVHKYHAIEYNVLLKENRQINIF